MMKRLSWFVSGAVAGVAGVGLAKRKVKATASQLAPAHMARAAVDHIRERGHDVAEGIRDGRRAMRDKEIELLARRDGTVGSLADELQPDDQVLVDGHPVEPGQVIVLRQVRDGAKPGQAGQPGQPGQRRHSRRLRRGA